MGCGSSKEKVCRNCQAPYSPARRSFSMHVHHPSQKTGDSSHLVALTSSTLGSLKLDFPSIQNHVVGDDRGTDKAAAEALPIQDQQDKAASGKGKIERKNSAAEEFAMGMIEAKTWSTMINEKIPKVVPQTPIRTPPGEPETVNVWEMMEGLEDISPLRTHQFRSFSFHVITSPPISSPIDDQDQPSPRAEEIDDNASPKPSWFDSADSDSNSNSNDTSVASEFDIPQANPFGHKPIEDAKHDKKIVQRGVDRLIVYFTSLRGVRKTYEDCRHVRVILKGLGVKVDERDVSMHSGFKEELKELLGEGFGGMGLPRVFLGTKCVGGAEEMRRLNEGGKLEKLVENCELVDGGGSNGILCEACGDIRFVPCEMCSGSCKIYYQGEYEEDEEEECHEGEPEFGFHRCPDCNENGLIRCPICCD